MRLEDGDVFYNEKTNELGFITDTGSEFELFTDDGCYERRTEEEFHAIGFIKIGKL